jgi:uncharacterized protein with beta-barrel porin domain
MGISTLRVMVLDADKAFHRTLRISGFAAALLFSTALTAPAFAGGGASGAFDGTGSSAGGADQLTGAGSNGQDVDCCGGGGGGAGATGGQGGMNFGNYPGGAGGSAPGMDGSPGSTGGDSSGGGGGGGAHGFVGIVLPTSVVKGGDGGAGAFSSGGGGAGGYGAVVIGGSSYLTGALSTTLAGGNGGAGGDGYNASQTGGGGGSGGVGLFLENHAANAAQFTINGAVTGGNGGAGGAFDGRGGDGGAGLVLANASSFTTWLGIDSAVSGGAGGAAGSAGTNGGIAGFGGAGLVGSNMIVAMRAGGSIAGGINPLGQQANAIEFISGISALRLSGPTSQLSGNILNDGVLYLSSTAAATVVDNAITGSGGLIKIGTESITLAGISTYTGSTVVDSGTLDVKGRITGTSSVTVNSGGTLMGTGVIGSLVSINSGGTFAPGNGTPGTSTAIYGDLAFQSGAIYLVQLNPSTASLASVTGSATLGGASVNAVFANGGYISKSYTILTATGGVSGTFASNVVNTNLPTNFKTGLSYDANNAYLNLTLNYTPTPRGPSAPVFTPLDQNQRNAANAVINFFNAGGAIPIAFGALTPAGLSQASGETSVGSQQTTFDAMNLFMGVMTDPFAAGRNDDVSPSGGGFSSYAEEHSPRSAYAMFTKAMPVKADPFAQRWNVWATGFGGSQTTDGNAATGSNTSTSRIYGAAVGADYRISPNTLAGFAMSGGGTTFSVANGGSGRSDLFQIGGFVRHTIGTGYLSAALSYAWQDVTTERNVAGIDQLQARFNVNAFSGRLEGGTRYVTPWMDLGATPYAAVQATAFDLPAYREQALSGPGAFALNYAAKDITSTRSELGVRTDKSYALTDSVLTLRSRFAWAHEFNPDRSVAATFQSVPGASFVVNGAQQSSDAALTTASAEVKWRSGFSLAAIFEGEFYDVTRSYAGKGVARYQW